MYSKPNIEIIKIDTEISLQYTSPGGQPTGDPLGVNERYKTDPFKSSLT